MLIIRTAHMFAIMEIWYRRIQPTLNWKHIDQLVFIEIYRFCRACTLLSSSSVLHNCDRSFSHWLLNLSQNVSYNYNCVHIFNLQFAAMCAMVCGLMNLHNFKPFKFCLQSIINCYILSIINFV